MQPVPPPDPDHIEQENFLRGRGYNNFNGPRRSFPREHAFIEFDPKNKGWYQAGTRMPSSSRPKHYWTRPCDGKRTGAWGRFKDALTGEGPDVFVTTSGDRRTLMRDRPQKWQWSGWPMERARMFDWLCDPDYRVQDEMLARNVTWTNTSSRLGAQYNFKTRRYESPRMFWQTGGAGPNNPYGGMRSGGRTRRDRTRCRTIIRRLTSSGGVRSQHGPANLQEEGRTYDVTGSRCVDKAS